MSDENPALEPDLIELATALGALQPAAIPNRDRILFRAGQAAASPPRHSGSRRRFWPAAAVVFAALSLGEGVMLANRPATQVVERIVVIHEPSPVRPAPATQEQTERTMPLPPEFAESNPGEIPTQARLRDQIARSGLSDSSPMPLSGRSSPRLPSLSGRDLFRKELRTALFSGDRS